MRRSSRTTEPMAALPARPRELSFRMLLDLQSTSFRLIECDHCGSLSRLMAIQPYFADGLATQISGIEEEIDCPLCGQRTQALGEVRD